MAEVMLQESNIHIPEWVVDLATFRRWADSGDFPERVRIDCLDGVLWVDSRMEDIFTHNQVKTEFTIVLGSLVKTERLGRYFADGIRISNLDADLSVEPDGSFVSRSGLHDRVRVLEGATGRQVELEGSPDMVLEIVSDSSVKKDTKNLRRKYAEAEIPEYWLVDVQRERLELDILRWTPQGYAPVRKRRGWMKSSVFWRAFRLSRQEDELGHPEFHLELEQVSDSRGDGNR